MNFVGTIMKHNSGPLTCASVNGKIFCCRAAFLSTQNHGSIGCGDDDARGGEETVKKDDANSPYGPVSTDDEKSKRTKYVWSM